MKFSLRNNFPAIARRMEQLPDEIANRAMVRALNQTVEQGRTQMARTIAEEFRVTVGGAKRRLIIERASFRGALRLRASLQANRAGGGRGMNLINFAEKSITLAAARKRVKAGEGGSYSLRNGAKVQKALQVQFQIKRSGGKKVIPGAFIATNKRTGGTAVFIREGKGRYPIKTLTTIDIPQMFNTRRINEVVRKVMLDKFSNNFDRELRVILKGFVK